MPRDDDFASPASDPELRVLATRYLLRVTAIFLLLVFAVFLALKWSGAAVRYGSQRVSGQLAPAWKVNGLVLDAVTREPIPWAHIEDDPAGPPPLFFADADHRGAFELLTLSERHKIRISAPNYVTSYPDIGRIWFLWLPRGAESRQFLLNPVTLNPPE
jgi:hypothetical protein